MLDTRRLGSDGPSLVESAVRHGDRAWSDQPTNNILAKSPKVKHLRLDAAPALSARFAGVSQMTFPEPAYDVHVLDLALDAAQP